MNKVTDSLENNPLAVMIHGGKIKILRYADDIVLVLDLLEEILNNIDKLLIKLFQFENEFLFIKLFNKTKL